MLTNLPVPDRGLLSVIVQLHRLIVCSTSADNCVQDCVSMTPAGQWDDVACGSSRQFICKKPDLDSAASTASAGCNCGEGWVTVSPCHL